MVLSVHSDAPIAYKIPLAKKIEFWQYSNCEYVIDIN